MEGLNPDIFVDIHTHNVYQNDSVASVYNIMATDPAKDSDSLFSVGLHPWYSEQLTLGELSDKLDYYANSKYIFAFGETGLDKKCGIPMLIQRDVYELHLKKSAEFNIPIVIHCVSAWDELLEISSRYPVTKIIHCYNGSIELTKRLANLGFLFSIGKSILNPISKIRSALPYIPTSRLFCETDDSSISIQTIYNSVGGLLRIRQEELKNTIFDNFLKLLERK
jgi:TatD DNase family protein